MASYDTVQEAAGRGADVLHRDVQLEAKFFRNAKGVVPVDAGAQEILDAANSGIQTTPGLDDLVVQDIADNPGSHHKVVRERMDGGEAISIIPALPSDSHWNKYTVDASDGDDFFSSICEGEHFKLAATGALTFATPKTVRNLVIKIDPDAAVSYGHIAGTVFYVDPATPADLRAVLPEGEPVQVRTLLPRDQVRETIVFDKLEVWVTPGNNGKPAVTISDPRTRADFPGTPEYTARINKASRGFRNDRVD